MTTTARFHFIQSPATTLRGRGVQTARRTRPAAQVRRPAALWQQTVRVNEGRSMIERLVCLLLALLAVAAIVYGTLVMVRTFRGDHFQQAVAKIANHEAR